MNRKTILIVEDEAIVAVDLAGKLRQLGYEVVGTVAAGEEAVESACRLLPRVVLMDIRLKGRMDGIEAADAIRRRIDVPVIYLTAHSDAATLARAKLSEPFGYILKPFDDRELATNIEMALHKHQSERQLREQREALRVSEERLAAVIDTAMDAIITVDENQRVLLFNAAAEKIFCCQAPEVVGKPLDRFLPERFREIHRSHIRTFGTTGATARSMSSPGTVYGRRANGEEFPVEATISQASIGGQKLYTVILRDITQRKQAEELARLYAQNRELDRLKSEFFANISHELRTPLALILGPIQKRLSAGGLTDEERRDLEVVKRNARLLLRHVNDLLDLSKLAAGGMKAEYAAVDLARLCRLVASYFEVSASERNIKYEIDIPDSLPAQVDPPKVERMIFNLLSNAFKFTPTGGSVRLAVRRSDNRAILEVEDTGPGIPPELRQTIFERFRQGEDGSSRRFGGTGLGLSIVKEFVSLHGGSVTVGEARGGTGSVFTVELPLRAPSGSEVRRIAEELDMAAAKQAAEELRIRSPARQQSDGMPAPGSAVVLVIEDNPDMNAFISETLSGTCRVFSAFDGEEGLEKALEVHPDLILCDVMMPRMRGDELVRELRRRRELDDVPVVILTAKADEKLQVELLKEGAQDYLYKPFGVEELLAKVERIIADRRRAAEQLRDTRQLSAHLLELRDQERKQIAQELHESIAQYLAVVTMQLTLARVSGAAPSLEAQRIQDEALALLGKCTTDIRTMSYVLHPAVLDHLGLAAAIDWHVTGFKERHDIEVALDIPADLGRLSAEHELALFRIMEEALMNVRRHSGSRKARVRVFRDASEVGLEVIDEGRGMPALEGQAAGHGPEGTGIPGMRERVRKLGGRFEIASGGDGTKVRSVLPFIQRKSEASSPQESD